MSNSVNAAMIVAHAREILASERAEFEELDFDACLFEALQDARDSWSLDTGGLSPASVDDAMEKLEASVNTYLARAAGVI